jgi:hypothetical protein
MRTRTTTAALAVLLLPLAACTSSSDAKPAATVTVTVAPSATPSPSPSATEDGPLKLGTATKWEWTDTDTPATGVTTAIGYKQPVKTTFATPEDDMGAEGKGYVWAALEVKVCTTTGMVSVSNSPWSLAFADGTRIEANNSTYGDFPKPEYPVGDTAIKAGDCIRGKIVFAVPGKQRPVKVIYSAVPEGDAPIEWAVSAK